MPSLEKEQLLNYLNQTYEPLIRHRANENDQQRQLAFPSRAIAAFALQTLGGLSPADAALCDVDGGGDEGVDSIHYDSTNSKLYLTQSKAAGDGGTDQPPLNDFLRFIDGAKLLLAGRLETFNELSAAQKQSIRDALSNTSLKVVAVFAHFGGELDDHRLRRIEDLKSAWDKNYNEERLFFRNFNRSAAHLELLKLRALPPVNDRLALESYARHDGDFNCVYGRVNAADLKRLYQTHSDALFAQNVRHYRGSNYVNDAVRRTVREEPSKLFYLNNGITALCRRITPTPQTAATPGANSIGEFDVEGLSVVNGAQTIGSINNSLGEGEEAHVLIKLIQVSEEQAPFGERISKATNFQSTVEGIDFLSTHPRLKSLAEILQESGIQFHYKRADEFGVNRTQPNRFNLAEAIESRVCSRFDAKRLVTLKKGPTSLYYEAKSRLETFIPDSLSARTLWREVQICRLAQEAIELARRGLGYGTNRQKQFLTHGTYVLKTLSIHHLRNLLHIDELNLSDSDTASAKLRIDEMIQRALVLSEQEYQSFYKEWSQVFRTQQDIRRIFIINREPIEQQTA